MGLLCCLCTHHTTEYEAFRTKNAVDLSLPNAPHVTRGTCVFDPSCSSIGLRLRHEETAFDADRYLGDLLPEEEDPLLSEALAFKPHWWRKRRQKQPPPRAQRAPIDDAPKNSSSGDSSTSGDGECYRGKGDDGQKHIASNDTTSKSGDSGGAKEQSQLEGDPSLPASTPPPLLLSPDMMQIPPAPAPAALKSTASAVAPPCSKGQNSQDGADSGESAKVAGSTGAIGSIASVTESGTNTAAETEGGPSVGKDSGGGGGGKRGGEEGDKLSFEGFTEEEREQMR